MKTMTALAMGCALTAGSMFAAGFASAQPGPRQGPGAGDRPGPPREFSLTYEQAKERWPNLTQERFDEMDTDGNGVLTPADRIGRGDRPGRPGPGQGPGAADRPGPPRDFSMTFEQAKERWPNLTQERFDEMDTDGDGVLTPADRMGRPGPRGEGDTNPRGERRPRDGRGPAPAE